MAESELETRVNKKIVNTSQQINNLYGQLRQLQTKLTHPAAISNLNSRFSTLDAQVQALVTAPAPTKIRYEPASVSISIGTYVSGDVDSIKTANGLTYNVNATATTPGFDVRVDFSGVNDFNRINIKTIYLGSVGDVIQVRLYNGSGWDDISMFTDTGGYYLWLTIEGIDSTTYIDSGAVTLSLYNVTLGDVGKHIYIDYVSLVEDSDI